MNFNLNINKEKLPEKIALILSFLILNNLLFLSLSFPQLLIKINFLIFLITVLVFYFKNIFENSFLKISFLFIIFISSSVRILEFCFIISSLNFANN